MSKQLVAHLQIKDPHGNKETLKCWVGESVSYSLYGGWNSSGLPFSLSNLQCNLPMYPKPNETVEDFKQRIIDTINNKSVCTVHIDVPTKIKFANS